jgi:hypothetical protein
MTQKVQQNLRRNGMIAEGSQTWHVDANTTIAGVDFQIPANDGTGDTLTFYPRFIDKVVVTDVAVTIDGKTYQPGNWDFYDVGGVPLSSNTSVSFGPGNILIKFRS